MPPKPRIFVNADQIRAARAYLNWSQEDLAAAADLSIATIRNIALAKSTRNLLEFI